MTGPAPMAPTTRDEALAQLSAAGERFTVAFGSLSDPQWTWSPDDKTWAPQQIAEHLVAVDELTGRLLGPGFGGFAEVNFTDEQRAKKDALIPRAVADRNTRIEAPESIRPKGRFATRGEALAALAATRDALATVVRTSTADFRSRGRPHPVLGTLDGIQWVIFAVAHGERHLAQLTELRAHPGFPAA